MKKILSVIILTLMILGLTGSIHAKLIDMGDGTVYDTHLQLTWLKDAKLGGPKNWYDALSWAENLVFAGFDNWRLPLADSACGEPNIIGYNCTGSEMGHLYYTELGNAPALGGEPGALCTGPFPNLEPFAYWSGTSAPGAFAWVFNFSGGGQNAGMVVQELQTWAVREGDRSAEIPEPSIEIEVWAKDPTQRYPVVLATKDWVLIGTTFGENFEHQYSGQDTLEALLLNSILRISNAIKPRVLLCAGGDSGDIGAVQNVFSSFVLNNNIDSFTLITVTPGNPLEVDFSTLSQYDVVVLDAATCKGEGYRFDVTPDAIDQLKSYLTAGGKIVGSAYLFVYWYDYLNWGRQLYNEDLATIFKGTKPDIAAFYASAVTTAPCSQDQIVKTDNYGMTPGSDPWFHYFWKLHMPIVEATVRIEPETLNLKSKGDFTAFITLPEGYDVADIDINSVMCEGVPAIRGNIADDTLEVKFYREGLVGVDPGDEVSFMVTGNLGNGMSFSGADTIRVTDPGKK